MDYTNKVLWKENSTVECDYDFIVQELKEAHRQNRQLMRQLKKAQEATNEALRAHAKMVRTLTETMRQNTVLATECDMWRQRAEKASAAYEQFVFETNIIQGVEHLTVAEARAIRKAMARLHHPDSGGDPERMKAWNSLLDRVEQDL